MGKFNWLVLKFRKVSKRKLKISVGKSKVVNSNASEGQKPLWEAQRNGGFQIFWINHMAG